MADLTHDIIQKIYDIYKQKGYVSENSVFDFIIDAGLPLDETDRVIDRLLAMGVLIQDEPSAPHVSVVEGNEDESDVDRTQLDYEEIYSRVLEIDPSLDYIIEYVRQIPAPRTHEISNLMAQAKSGNEYAKNRVIELMMKVAVKMALHFTERYHTDMGDTIQYAFEGLTIAYEKFEIGRQDNFTTYAPWWIRQNLHRTIDVCYGLHTPAHYDDKLMAVLDIYNEHSCEECNKHEICPVFISDVSEKLEISKEQAKNCWLCMQEPICIDELVETDDPRLLTWTNDEIVDEVAFWILKDQIEELLYTLTSRESKVLRMRFGIDDDVEQSLEDIGKEFGVTRERIRQIEAKALRKLRHPSRSKKVKDFVDLDFPMILTERLQKDVKKNKEYLQSETVDDDILEVYEIEDEIDEDIFIEDVPEENTPVETSVSLTSEEEKLRDVLNQLMPREAKVVCMLTGLKVPGIYEGEKMSKEDVAKAHNVCVNRINHIEAKALRRIRHADRISKLSAFLDENPIEQIDETTKYETELGVEEIQSFEEVVESSVVEAETEPEDVVVAQTVVETDEWEFTPEAIKELEEMANAYDVNAMLDLADLYFFNDHNEEALYWYEMAAEFEDPEGMYNAGLMYRDGLGTDKDQDKAQSLFRKAAEYNHAASMNEIGVYYHNLKNVRGKHTDALHWYMKAAELGNMHAQCNLGWYYEYGLGCEIDLFLAKRYYELSAEQGFEDAIKYLKRLNNKI